MPKWRPHEGGTLAIRRSSVLATTAEGRPALAAEPTIRNRRASRNLNSRPPLINLCFFLENKFYLSGHLRITRTAESNLLCTLKAVAALGVSLPPRTPTPLRLTLPRA